ncbi:MAG: recombinase RecT [Treponema sp.]|uniref:recombinase RecT n=1 Tax=Treponema sp. TaxID=166 RepID=UPI003FA26268
MNVNTKQKQQEIKQNSSLRDMIMRNMDMFKMAVPKTVTPERMARIAMTAVTKNPKLALCSPASFFGALLTAAQLGLEVNTPLGQSYLIPYNGKRGMECQFQLGYQGILDLAYRTGKFRRIKAVVVHAGDDFIYSYGLHAVLTHVPKMIGTPTHVYALYELLNGGIDFEVWTWEQVIAHAKQYSQSFSKADSSWQTAPEEMAKKTVLKALLKYAPKAVEYANPEQEGLATAINMDGGIITKNIVRDGDYQEITDTVDYETGDDVQIPEAPAHKVPNEPPPTQMAEPASPSPQRSDTTQPKLPAGKDATISAETETQLNALWDAQQQATFDDLGFPM